MIKNNLYKLIGISVLYVMFYVPVATAAPIVELFFDASILERSPSSPLALNDRVTGSINVDSADQTWGPVHDPLYPNLVGYGYDGSVSNTTFGYANKTPFIPGDWEFSPGSDVFVGLGNNYALTADDVSDIPSYVTSPPSVGDEFDLIEIEVIKSRFGTWTIGDEYLVFGLSFAFDPADNVVTGLTMGDVDFTRLFTDAAYTEFTAEHYLDDGTDDGDVYWEAIGPLIGGSVSAVPIPAAAWLFGSGLLGLIGFSRRRLT